jgi:hypothetical protein
MENSEYIYLDKVKIYKLGLGNNTKYWGENNNKKCFEILYEKDKPKVTITMLDSNDLNYIFTVLYNLLARKNYSDSVYLGDNLSCHNQDFSKYGFKKNILDNFRKYKNEFGFRNSSKARFGANGKDNPAQAQNTITKIDNLIKIIDNIVINVDGLSEKMVKIILDSSPQYNSLIEYINLENKEFYDNNSRNNLNNMRYKILTDIKYTDIKDTDQKNILNIYQQKQSNKEIKDIFEISDDHRKKFKLDFKKKKINYQAPFVEIIEGDKKGQATEKTLGYYNFKIFPIVGDGNCFYKALADQLYRQNILYEDEINKKRFYNYKDLKQIFIDSIFSDKNKKILENIFNNEDTKQRYEIVEKIKTFEEYKKNISDTKLNFWADGLTVEFLNSYLKKKFNKPINIIMKYQAMYIEENQIYSVNPKEIFDTKKTGLYILQEGNHYQSLIPQKNFYTEKTSN